MTPAIAKLLKEAFSSKITIIIIAIESFPCRGEHVRTYISGSRCTRWQKTTNRHTHTYTRESHGDDTIKII